MSDSNDAPLEFSDEALLRALKASPPQTQAQVHIIAMQQEVRDRRAAEAEAVQ